MEGELRDLMRGLVAGEGRKLVDEARDEARAEVRKLLVEFFTEDLIDQVLSVASPSAPNVQRLRPRETSEEDAESSGVGVYVYAVVASEAASEWGGRGIDEAPVRSIEVGDLAALVSDVRLSVFGQEPLQENLNDLAWLTEKVGVHQEVLARAVDVTTIVPMRFCTIYRDDESVEGMLQRHGDDIAQALRALRGRDEYGVKISFSLATPTVGDVAGSDVTDGRTYLERKQSERRIGEEMRAQAETAARAAHARLDAHAERSSLGRLQRDPALATEGRELVLNASYLVAEENRAVFFAEAESLAAEWPDLNLERTGPWPPYNFVTLQLEDRRGRDTG